MTGFVNPLAPKTNRLQARSAEIKTWIRELLELPDDTPVSVTELACRDPGCPDIETVIGVLEPGRPVRTIRVHASLVEIKYGMVADIVAARS
jgi:hypothetical protein